MRKAFASVILILAAALCVCIFFARRSGKKNANTVSLLIASLIPPLIGNLLIIVTEDHLVADIGSFMYFLGMDVIMICLIRFTIEYCNIKPNSALRNLIYIVLIADMIQLALNPVFGHAFSHEIITVNNVAYFRLVPRIGQAFHRVAVYGALAIVIWRFTVMTVRSPRVDAERYLVILLAMIITALWETFYIFSRTPIDRSMIGFGVCGLLVFYFALYYKPVRLLNRMMAGIVGEMHEALFFFDKGGECIWTNEPGTELAGIMPGEYRGAPAKLEERFGNLPQEGQGARRFIEGSGENARYFVIERRPIEDRSQLAAGSFLSIRDDTEEQRERLRELYQATHDRLTGLYNIDHLHDCVRKVIDNNPGTRWLVAFINIRDFKMINDIFGNEFGDLVLKKVAKWVTDSMPENSLYGRMAGDTFGVCMRAGSFIAEPIERSLSDFRVSSGDISHAVLIQMGVYEITEPDLDVSVMFDRARIALSTIRNDYRAHIAHYDEKMRSSMLLNKQLSGQLTDAIGKQQIVPYLQPITDRTGRVAGAEALARWIHPEKGFLSPAVFIPVFEENGMIAQLDRAVWRSVCEILNEWKESRPDLFISVNISPKDFYFMDVAKEIREITAEYGVAPEKLRLEITETVMMNDEENHLKVINGLREAGYLVELDDFGSGYSSFNMLKDLPADVLKIDMRFLSKGGDPKKARRILSSIVQLAEDLGMGSVIEGVETGEQYRMLAEMGCRMFQGYFIARPMPRQDFESFLG